MTETMFARARTPKSSLGLALVIATVTVLATGFLAGTVSRPRAEAGEMRAAAAATAPVRG